MPRRSEGIALGSAPFEGIAGRDTKRLGWVKVDGLPDIDNWQCYIGQISRRFFITYIYIYI